MPNEAYYCAQKAVRAMGTNSIDNAARVCHSPSTVALKTTIGAGATTCSYSDWLEADVLVFIGSNVANNQPVATKYLHYAKKNGARIVAINPYREPGMERYWIPSIVESALFGTPVDHGATLLHSADRNPLVPIAKQFGFGTEPDDGDVSVYRGTEIVAGGATQLNASLERFGDVIEAAGEAGRDVAAGSLFRPENDIDRLAAIMAGPLAHGAENGSPAATPLVFRLELTQRRRARQACRSCGNTHGVGVIMKMSP